MMLCQREIDLRRRVCFEQDSELLSGMSREASKRMSVWRSRVIRMRLLSLRRTSAGRGESGIGPHPTSILVARFR